MAGDIWMKKSLFYISIFIFSWIYAVFFNNIDWDFWARLAVGKIFFQTGSVLQHDIFSYTPTKPLLIDHEWGSGVVFYFLTSHFGDIGILLFKIISIFLILFIISKINELRNTRSDEHLNLFFYYLVLLGMFYCISGTVRCQMFTFMFFTLWIYILERIRHGENRLLWTIPATALIWANLHGGFISGLGLLVIYGIGEFLNKKPFTKYFLIMIPSALITIINPYGVKYWEYLIQAATMPRSTISEWLPTNIFPLNKWKGFKLFALTSTIAGIAGLIRKKIRYNELDKVKYLLLGITFYLAMAHNKHQALFAISAASFLYHDFYSIFDSIKNLFISGFGEKAEKVLNAAAKSKNIISFVFIIFIGCVLIFSTPFRMIVNPLRFPVGSVEFIKKNHLSGNILSLFHWGSYIAWNLYPNSLIAEDGRYEEIYPEYLHMSVYNFNYKINERWNSFLNQYHTDIIIMDKSNNRSFNAMLYNKKWKMIYNDFVSAVFVPSSRVRKSYILPKITSKDIINNKYNSDIDFNKE